MRGLALESHNNQKLFMIEYDIKVGKSSYFQISPSSKSKKYLHVYVQLIKNQTDA